MTCLIVFWMWLKHHMQELHKGCVSFRKMIKFRPKDCWVFLSIQRKYLNKTFIDIIYLSMRYWRAQTTAQSSFGMRQINGRKVQQWKLLNTMASMWAPAQGVSNCSLLRRHIPEECWLPRHLQIDGLSYRWDVGIQPKPAELVWSHQVPSQDVLCLWSQQV